MYKQWYKGLQVNSKYTFFTDYAENKVTLYEKNVEMFVNHPKNVIKNTPF